MMRGFASLAVCAVLLFYTTVIYAAPVGNPAEPILLEKGHNYDASRYPVKASGIVSYIFRRDLDKGEAKVDKGMEYVGKVAVNFDKKADVYGILGASQDVEIRKDGDIISGSSTDTNLSAAFLYGLGATLVAFDTPLWEGVFRVGLDGKYQRYEADIDKLKRDGAELTVGSDEVESQEWQIAVGISYEYGSFVPYAGGKYSDVVIEESVTAGGTSYSNKLHSDKILGLFAGCDFIFSDNAKMNVEGRFIDEMALSVSGTLMF